MSDVPPSTEEKRPDTVPRAANETNPLRLILLLLVFGVALAGLLWDYTIARPTYQKAVQTVNDLLDGTMKDPSGDGS